MNRGAKTKQVRLLLTTTDYSAADISDICGCSYPLVTKIRRDLRLPYANATAAGRMARLEEDVRELRSVIRKLVAVTTGDAAICSTRIAGPD